MARARVRVEGPRRVLRDGVRVRDRVRGRGRG